MYVVVVSEARLAAAEERAQVAAAEVAEQALALQTHRQLLDDAQDQARLQKL